MAAVKSKRFIENSQEAIINQLLPLREVKRIQVLPLTS